MTTKKTIEILRCDGYHSAADLIEQLRDGINRDAEFECIVNFAKDNCFNDDDRNCEWLRMLWTVFCLHQDLAIDTVGYDHSLYTLWGYIMKNEDRKRSWGSYNNFDGFMCKYLV